MNGYTKKVITTALFSLLFLGIGNYVSSMECMEIERKIPEQVSVKYTIDLVDKFEKLNDASDYFKKTFPENWKNYLDLYNKCFKKISNKKADYIKNIEEFEKMHNSGVRNSGSLVEYEKVLTENIEYVDKMIKELYKKIDEKYGKLPKVGFFASLFTKSDDRTLLVNYVNKLSEDHRKTKREIAEKVGILTKKSINRNILQASNNSPLKKLEKLYNALQQGSGEFAFEKNLLETSKAFDIKVENSLQKVVDCKWDEYIGIGQKFSSHLSESNSSVTEELNVLDKFVNKRQVMLETKIEFFKTNKNSKEYLELIEDNREKIIVGIGNRAKKKLLEDNDKKLFEFYAKISSLKMCLLGLQ